MAKFILLVLLALALALVAASASASTTGERAFTTAAWHDDSLPQRQEAMAEAVRAMSNYDPAGGQGGDEAVQRAMGVVNGELARLRPIFKAIGKMPEGSAAEVRAKEEARAAANELLTRHLGQLLPGGSATITDDL